MRILDVHGDNAPFFQELAQAKRRVLGGGLRQRDRALQRRPSGMPYPDRH